MEQKPSHDGQLNKELKELKVSENKSVLEVKRTEKKVDKTIYLIFIGFAILIIVNVMFLVLVNSDLSAIKTDLNLINSSLQNVNKNVSALQIQGEAEFYLSLAAIVLSIISMTLSLNGKFNSFKNKKKHKH